MMNPIFDAHCHLPESEVEYTLNTIGRNIIFNSVSDYKNRSAILPSNCIKSLIFDFKENLDFVKGEASSGNLAAYKIHNRIQHLKKEELNSLIDALKKCKDRLPVIVDSFYYGHDLEHQPRLDDLIQLALSFPERKFIAAHCGGHLAQDYFLHLRTLPNVYFDVSFSLVYLQNNSSFSDLVHLIRHNGPHRILFGTDFPFIDPIRQRDIFFEILQTCEFDEQAIKRMCFQNAQELFHIHSSK